MLQQTTDADMSEMLRTGDVDPRALRSAFGAIPSAVAVLGAADPGMPVSEGIGMTVATLLPVSLDPPCLGVMVQLGSTTWPALEAFDEIGVSVLADHQGWVGRRVATGPRAAPAPADVRQPPGCRVAAPRSRGR